MENHSQYNQTVYQTPQPSGSRCWLRSDFLNVSYLTLPSLVAYYLDVYTEPWKAKDKRGCKCQSPRRTQGSGKNLVRTKEIRQWKRKGTGKGSAVVEICVQGGVHRETQSDSLHCAPGSRSSAQREWPRRSFPPQHCSGRQWEGAGSWCLPACCWYGDGPTGSPPSRL